MKRMMTVFLITAVFALMGLSAVVFADVVVEPDPAAYVSVDAGTGFELTLNEENQVLTVEAVEEAGEAVLDGIDLTGQPVDEAVGQLIDEAIAEGVLPTDGTVPVDVTVVTEEGDQTAAEEDLLSDAITDEIIDAIEELEVPVVVTYQNAALERVALARTLGITPGKLNLLQKYAASTADPEAVILTDWTGKSVKEIMGAIKENRKATEATEDPLETEETVDDPADIPDTNVTQEPTVSTGESSAEQSPAASDKSGKSSTKENKGGKGKSGGKKK